MKSAPWMLLSILGLAAWIATAPAQNETNSAPAPDSTATTSAPVANTSTNAVLTLPPPDNAVTGTVNTYSYNTNNAVNLTEEQKDKIRATLKRAQLSEDQKKRQAELLDKTPVLEEKINPGMTEKGGIPKRF